MLGTDFRSSTIVGSGLALSSTAIVLKILNETGQIKRDFGRNSLGILIFQDIAVIPILLLITLFTNQEKGLAALLLTAAVDAVLALAILILVGRYLLGHVFRIVSAAKSKEIYMGSVLLTVIGASYVAHEFGFSYSLGAFIAGMMIADTIYKYQVEADLIPFRDLLLGVFFVSVGLQIEINIVLANLVTILVLGVVVMGLKAALVFAILGFAGDRRTAMKTAITLSQVGEFSLVVFSLVLSNRMLDPTWVQIALVTIVATMIVTPVLINNLDRITDLFFKRRAQAQALDQASTISGHVILCGYGAFGRAVSDRLDRSGDNHVILTDNTEDYVKAKEDGKTVVYGDPADQVLLERSRIKDALGTIVAMDDFDHVKRTCAAITLIDPSLRLIAKVPTEEDRAALSDFNNELVIDDNSHSASLLVQQIDKSRMLAAETSSLQFLGDYSLDDPAAAITKVEREQVRLLDIMSRSFDALREEQGLLKVKALHDSFMVLSDIIGEVIQDIMSNAELSVGEYERINTLLDNQHQLESINHLLEKLGKELITLSRNDKTSDLAAMSVEGLDTILLTLQELARDFDEDEINILKRMTGRESEGLARIRQNYLGSNIGLDAETKAMLLSSTNHMDHLKSLFGLVGRNYRKLAGAT
jgi:CPA2 family monovalent cation:H+ antiporter-2